MHRLILEWNLLEASEVVDKWDAPMVEPSIRDEDREESSQAPAFTAMPSSSTRFANPSF